MSSRICTHYERSDTQVFEATTWCMGYEGVWHFRVGRSHVRCCIYCYYWVYAMAWSTVSRRKARQMFAIDCCSGATIVAQLPCFAHHRSHHRLLILMCVMPLASSRASAHPPKWMTGRLLTWASRRLLGGGGLAHACLPVPNQCRYQLVIATCTFYIGFPSSAALCTEVAACKFHDSPKPPVLHFQLGFTSYYLCELLVWHVKWRGQMHYI